MTTISSNGSSKERKSKREGGRGRGLDLDHLLGAGRQQVVEGDILLPRDLCEAKGGIHRQH